ncbi:MAG TPA: GNAT family N-acetyltransferase [Thermoanaerobaculia bacterium]|nr:GNAT family N-acetyltransferase [Thermoanaerobaculia bacterium]
MSDGEPTSQPPVRVRPTEPADFSGIVALCRSVYPGNVPYDPQMLASHLEVFPAGQLTAVEVAPEGGEERVVGMAASLIIDWNDYDVEHGWRDFTARGYFVNHDPSGHTLYGAEVMVDPAMQGHGVGSALYEARDELMRRLGLWRIRAGARLRGYHAHADRLAAEEYVAKVVAGELRDPTLSFQLHRGFTVLAVVSGYLRNDPKSLGHAAVIEKLNPEGRRD